jgi:predicted transcriptional regulator
MKIQKLIKIYFPNSVEIKHYIEAETLIENNSKTSNTTVMYSVNNEDFVGIVKEIMTQFEKENVILDEQIVDAIDNEIVNDGNDVFYLQIRSCNISSIEGYESINIWLIEDTLTKHLIKATQIKKVYGYCKTKSQTIIFEVNK